MAGLGLFRDEWVEINMLKSALTGLCFTESNRPVFNCAASNVTVSRFRANNLHFTLQKLVLSTELIM